MLCHPCLTAVTRLWSGLVGFILLLELKFSSVYLLLHFSA